jgi:protein transport protein YIF1
LLTTSRTITYILFTYFLAANAFFLLRSLRSILLPDTSHPNTTGAYSSPYGGGGAGGGGGGVNYSVHTSQSVHGQKRRRVAFLFFEAVACQVLWMGVLCWV